MQAPLIISLYPVVPELRVFTDAHGFAVLSDIAVFQYKCDNYYHPEADGGISIADPSLAIDWRLDPSQAILSEKDTHHPLLKDFDSPFIKSEG